MGKVSRKAVWPCFQCLYFLLIFDTIDNQIFVSIMLLAFIFLLPSFGYGGQDFSVRKEVIEDTGGFFLWEFLLFLILKAV